MQDGANMAATYEDLLYTEHDRIATITINRPARYNAFRGKTRLRTNAR
jgi:1,4-dihydroxy-2-naphthoyl-CoA synthase